MMTESRGADIVFEGRNARVVSVRDVTERKRTEDELREVTAWFGVAVRRQTPNGIALVRDRRTAAPGEPGPLPHSQSHRRGSSATHIPGRHPSERPRSRTSNSERQFLDGTMTTTTFEKRYIHADGHVVWVNLSASLIERRPRSQAEMYFIATSRTSADAKTPSNHLQRRPRDVCNSLQRVAVAANEASEPAESFATKH